MVLLSQVVNEGEHEHDVSSNGDDDGTTTLWCDLIVVDCGVGTSEGSGDIAVKGRDVVEGDEELLAAMSKAHACCKGSRRGFRCSLFSCLVNFLFCGVIIFRIS